MVEELHGTLPEVPSVRRARLQAQWDISDLEMRTLVNAEALDLVELTIDQGVDQAAARAVDREFTRIANDKESP